VEDLADFVAAYLYLLIMASAAGIALAAFIGVLISRSRQRDAWEGVVLGGLFGPLGWLALSLLSRGIPEQAARPADLIQPDVRQRRCPFCAEMVRYEAALCRYCGRDLPPIGEFVFCSECGRSLEREEAVEHDGRTWCRSDYEAVASIAESV